MPVRRRRGRAEDEVRTLVPRNRRREPGPSAPVTPDLSVYKGSLGLGGGVGKQEWRVVRFLGRTKGRDSWFGPELTGPCPRPLRPGTDVLGGERGRPWESWFTAVTTRGLGVVWFVRGWMSSNRSFDPSGLSLSSPTPPPPCPCRSRHPRVRRGQGARGRRSGETSRSESPVTHVRWSWVPRGATPSPPPAHLFPDLDYFAHRDKGRPYLTM